MLLLISLLVLVGGYFLRRTMIEAGHTSSADAHTTLWNAKRYVSYNGHLMIEASWIHEIRTSSRKIGYSQQPLAEVSNLPLT